MRNFYINSYGSYNIFEMIKVKSQFFCLIKFFIDLLVNISILVLIILFDKLNSLELVYDKNYYYLTGFLYFEICIFLEIFISLFLLNYYIYFKKKKMQNRFKKFFKNYLKVQIIMNFFSLLFLLISNIYLTMKFFKKVIGDGKELKYYFGCFDFLVEYLPYYFLLFLKIFPINNYYNAKTEYENDIS